MSDSYEKPAGYRFSDYALRLDRGALLLNGKEIKLRPKSFEVLKHLVEHAGNLVSRQQLLDAVWPGAVVTDDAVTQCLIDIRKAIRDSAQDKIRTVPRRGYIFDVPVTVADDAPDSGVAAGSRRWAKAAWVAVPVIALAVGVTVLLSRPQTLPDRPMAIETETRQPAVAVLPFAVLSEEQDQAYFADGVSEEILNQLARQSGLKVIARTSSFSFRGSQADLNTKAEQLGVTHVLEGSIRKDGDTVRIDVKLVDALTGEYLWGDSFDRALSASNLFAIQDEIAASVVTKLESEFALGEPRFRSRIPTDNLEALDAYFAGRQLMETRRPDALARANEYFQKAVELDQGFALAHVALADNYRLLSNYGDLPVDRANELMKAAVDKAMSIDSEFGEVHTSLANYYRRTGNPREAERAFQRAIELNPNYAPAYQWYGEFLSLNDGRPEEALHYARMAVALDPMSAIINADYARALSAAGRQEEALRQFDVALEVDPDFATAIFHKGEIHGALGMVATSVEFSNAAIEADPTALRPREGLAYAWLVLGDFEKAKTQIDESMQMTPDHPLPYLALLEWQVLESTPDDAEQTAHSVLEQMPHVPRVLRYLRDFRLARDDAGAAVEYYRQSFPDLLAEQEVAIHRGNYVVAIDLAYVLMQIGRTDRANELLDGAQAVIANHHRLGWPDWGYGISDVRIHAIRGNHEAALDALEEAIDAGWIALWRTALGHDLALEPLRGTERFQSLYARLDAEMARQLRTLEGERRLAESQ